MTPSAALHLFGTPRIVIDESGIPLSSAAVIGVAAYLALHQQAAQPVGRSRLAGTLWPDLSEAQARRTLTGALYRLRRLLGPRADCLIADSQWVGLRDLWIDVVEFRRGTAATSPAAWKTALDLYAGELCSDYDAEWLDQWRADLHQVYLTTLERCVAVFSDACDYTEALRLARQWAAVDPLNEVAHTSIMRLQARLGRYTAAVQQFNQLAELLDQELGVTPLPETVALIEQLRHELEVAHQRALHTRQQPAQPVFVGRTAERAQVLDAVEMAALNHGGLLVVEGVAGIGKTRLLHELAASATWRGFTVLWGDSSDQVSTPYAPLDQALGSIASGPRLAALRAQLSPVALAALVGLLPQLRGDTPLQMLSSPNLPAALAEALQLLSQSTPLLLILDNVQWASPAFWESFAFGAAQVGLLRGARVLMVLTYRPAEMRTNVYGWATLSQLERSFAPTRILLEGLSRREAQELIQQLAIQRSLAAAQAELDALYALSAGNPLYLAESFIGHQAATPHGSFTRVLEQRLADISPSAQAALELAVVLGRDWSLARWQSVGLEHTDRIIAELIEARFIRTSAAGFVFHHDLVYEFVIASIAPERLRALHERMALALRAEDAPADLQAWHCEHAGLWEDALRLYEQAGAHAEAAYAHSTALEYLNRALALLEHQAAPSATVRLRLLCLRQRALGVLVLAKPWQADVDSIEELATALGDEHALLEALEARITLLSLQSDIAGMVAVATAAQELARRLELPRAEARLLRLYGFHLLANASFPPAETLPLLRRSVELAEQVGDRAMLVSALCTLAFGECVMGQTSAAHNHAAQALTLTELHPELYPARADVLRVLANAALNRAEWETARATMHKSIALTQEQNDMWVLAVGLFMAVYVFGGMGQRTEASAAVDQLRALLIRANVAESSNWNLYVQAVAIDGALQTGDLAAADSIVSGLQPWLDSAPKAGAAIYLLTEIGALRLFQNRPREALRYLREALPLWYAARTGFLPLLLTHALAAHVAGETDEALESMAVAEAHFSSHEIAYCAVLFHFTRFWVRGSRQDVQAAHEAIHAQAARFRSPELREAFLRDVRMHVVVELLWRIRPLATTLRSVAGLWLRISRTYTGPAPDAEPGVGLVQQRVLLARIDAPLGKALSSDERVAVEWTIHAPEDLELDDRTAQRHHRLQRLLAEAATQGAAPTDDDLAQALQVSRRTIIRDMAVLVQSGVALPTRRRK